jgi:hypothetical protein
MTYYAFFHMRRPDGSTIELAHGHDLYLSDVAACDRWLSEHRAREEYRRRRGELAALKETHGCGYRPRIEAVTT